MAKVITTSTIPLNAALQEQVSKGTLASLDSADVTPFLASQLQWGVALANGTVIKTNDVPGLQLQVVAGETVVKSDDASLPTVQNLQPVVEATQNKTAGFDPAEANNGGIQAEPVAPANQDTPDSYSESAEATPDATSTMADYNGLSSVMSSSVVLPSISAITTKSQSASQFVPEVSSGTIKSISTLLLAVVLSATIF